MKIINRIKRWFFLRKYTPRAERWLEMYLNVDCPASEFCNEPCYICNPKEKSCKFVNNYTLWMGIRHKLEQIRKLFQYISRAIMGLRVKEPPVIIDYYHALWWREPGPFYVGRLL